MACNCESAKDRRIAELEAEIERVNAKLAERDALITEAAKMLLRVTLAAPNAELSGACEMCDRPATNRDVNGISLCAECWDELLVETMEFQQWRKAR